MESNGLTIDKQWTAMEFNSKTPLSIDNHRLYRGVFSHFMEMYEKVFPTQNLPHSTMGIRDDYGHGKSQISSI